MQNLNHSQEVDKILADTDISLERSHSTLRHPRQRSHKKRIAKIIFVLAIIVAAAICLVWYLIHNPGANDLSNVATEISEIAETSEVANEILPNTELGSGTVSTVIDGKTVTYSAAYLVDGVEATIGSGTYESLSDNEAVFLVINGGSLKIQGADISIKKSGSENFEGRGDDYSFYGTNSAIVVVGEGSKLEINGGVTIETTTSGANAIVATNSATADVKNAKISTTADNSRGLHATYQGIISANNTEISTQGGSCASLATDRGEGTVTAENMTLSTAGAGSPLIYSTGDITVKSSTGTATGAQIAVVEGKNSLTLEDVNFKAAGTGNRNSVDNAAIMIYQSMSGDAGEGTGSFTAKNSTLAVLEDSSVYSATPFFFVTNTTANINLDTVITTFSPSQSFISAKATSEWGRSGQNGGHVILNTTNLTATNETVSTDSLSSVD